VGKCDFYNEWEAIVSYRVPPVPIDSFIDEHYNISLYHQNNPFLTV